VTTAISEGPPPSARKPTERPTHVRYFVLALAVAVALLLYIDRYCVSNATNDIKTTLGLDDQQVALMLGVFFFSYAFGQLGGGWLADRFGARKVLSIAIVAWSTCTALIGLAVGFWDMIAYRFWCGLFESVAYPACAGMIRQWFPTTERGAASGFVSLGGRLGGFITPKLTVVLIGLSAMLFPAVASWRPVFLGFGLIGICLAGLFWLVHRDRPDQHSAANAAERALIAEGSPPPASPTAVTASTTVIAAPSSGLLRAVVTNRSLWLCSIVQAGSNFGWVFLFTLFPQYLYQVHQTDRATNGTMCSTVGFIPMFAVIAGGFLADATTRRLGKRWGRALPLSLPRFVSAGFYILVAVLSMVWFQAGNGPEARSSPTEMQSWTIVVLCGFIAFFSDLTLPAIWAYSLDVGGKSAGFVLGWGNMWGNLGAFVSPLLLMPAAKAFGWTSVFWICGGVFFTIAVLSLFVDATDTVDT
jgi:sugar phosphate permease